MHRALPYGGGSLSEHRLLRDVSGRAADEGNLCKDGAGRDAALYGGASGGRSGTAEQMAAVLAALPEFPAMRKMLDLGGGHGLFAQAFVRAHPSMTAIIFDRAPVLTVAEEFIRENGMQKIGRAHV